MQIKTQIDEIIKKRQSKVPGIEKTTKKLQQLLLELQKVGELRAKMLQNASEFQISEDVRQNIAQLDISEARQELDTLITRYQEVITRFSREEISIAVVGGARQGKSKLLQSISDLSDNVIPAFESNDCTGATSVIKNAPGAAVSAKITFLSEREVMQSVQNYLDCIFGKNSVQVDSFRRIQALQAENLRNRLEQGSPQTEKFNHLEKYIEHFDEWSPLVQERTRVITDEREIQRYVAQHNGRPENDPGRVNYYNYLAVKSVEISCTFQNPDAGKIVLRDTIGLGDTSLGIEQKMLDAIGLHSDAAIIVRRPEVGTGSFGQSDSDLYAKLRDRFHRRNMGKWLFWLVNHTTKDSFYGENLNRCQTFRDRVSKGGYDMAGCEIVDVSDGDQVNNEFLPTVLKTLIQNMDAIDAGILSDIKEQADRAYRAYGKLQQAVKNIMLSEMHHSVDTDEFLDERWKAFYNYGLMQSLKEYRKELKSQKDTECEQFRNCIQQILRESNSLIPSSEALLKELRGGGATRPPEVYGRHIDRIRTNFTEMFLNIDEQIFDEQNRRFKARVVDIFAGEEGGRLGHLLPVDRVQDKVQWLSLAAEELFAEKKYSQFRTAFMTLGEFQLTVRGFLMHRIRARIDRLNETGFLIGDSHSDEEIAQIIHNALEEKLEKVQEELHDALQRNEFYQDPNRIFYAVMEEFYDRVNYSYTDIDAQGAENMWKILYRRDCDKIWMDEFAQNKAISQLYNEWSSLSNQLKTYQYADFALT